MEAQGKKYMEERYSWADALFVCLLLFAFIFGSICFWAISFCFFSFVWGIFFFCEDIFCEASSSGLGSICSFSGRIISMWQGELMYGLIQPWDLLVLCPILGTLFTWMCSMTTESTSKPVSSTLLSAFLSMCSKNSALFLGHQPWVQPHCLACAHLPTPPLRRNGTHCFFQATAFRYLVAFQIRIPLTAWAVS